MEPSSVHASDSRLVCCVGIDLGCNLALGTGGQCFSINGSNHALVVSQQRLGGHWGLGAALVSLPAARPLELGVAWIRCTQAALGSMQLGSCGSGQHAKPPHSIAACCLIAHASPCTPVLPSHLQVAGDGVLSRDAACDSLEAGPSTGLRVKEALGEGRVFSLRRHASTHIRSWSSGPRRSLAQFVSPYRSTL